MPGILNIEANDEGYNLTLANKQLDLYLMTEGDIGVASTFVKNINGQPKEEGATTSLYRQAKVLILEAVKRFGKPIRYVFCTEFESMEEWAIDPERGCEIFDWDIRVSSSDSAKGKFIAEKLFEPGSDD